MASPALLSLPQGPVYAVGATSYTSSRPALSPCAAPAAPWRPGALAPWRPGALAPLPVQPPRHHSATTHQHHQPPPRPTRPLVRPAPLAPPPSPFAYHLPTAPHNCLHTLCTPVRVQVYRRAGTGQPEGGRREQARLDARGGRGGGGHGARPCAKQSKAAAQRTPRQKLRPPARPPAHPVYSSARSKHMAPPPPRPIRQLRPGWPAGHPALFGLLAHN